MEPIVNKIKDGIHMDNAVLEQPEDTYRYARNFVIHQVANGMYKAATLRGTELYFTMPANEKPMAFTSIRNRYFMIVLNTVDNIVKFYEVLDSVGGTCTLSLLRQPISNSYLNLSFDWPIRTIFGFYENDSVQRIYWTDYNNSPRVINVQDMEVDDSKFAKYLSFTPVLENIYGQLIFNSIDAGGNLLNGNYFIAWQYYTKDGYYSDWSPLSTAISVTPSTPMGTIDGYQEFEGAAPSLNSSKSINFKIKNIDTDYDSIRIAAFYSNDYNSAGPGIIFYDGDISSDEMTFFLRGSENLGTLTLDELIEHTMAVDKCKSLAPVKLYNVAACIKERDEIDFMPFHKNNLLPVNVAIKYNELLADTTGYPSYPYTTGPKILFGVPKCDYIYGGAVGYGGIWYKALFVSVITPVIGASKTLQQGEYYRCTSDNGGKFTLNSGMMVPVHKINKYDSEGVALKGVVTTIQTAQIATAREDTFIVYGTWGNGTITINGLTRAITFSNDIHDTVTNFVSIWGADYLDAGVRLSAHGGMATAHVLIATAVTPGTDFTGPTSLDAITGDLSGGPVNTTPFLPKVAQISSLLLSGTEGFANFTFNGTSYVIPFLNSTYESNYWFYQNRTLFPEVTITEDMSNHLIFTANIAGTPFTMSLTHLSSTGSLNGAASVVSAFSEGINEMRTLDFAGSTNGNMNIIFGGGVYSAMLEFNSGTLHDAIVTFYNRYRTYFYANNIEISISYPGTTVLYIKAHNAGTPLPVITFQVQYGHMVATNTLYQANAGPTIRQDKVIFNGTGGGISITCANYTYRTWWQGTILSTIQKFLNDYAGFLNISYVIATLDPSNEAILFTSKFANQDFPGITSATHTPDGSLAGDVTEVVPNFIGNKRKVTITLTGTAGAANISANNLTRKITFDSSLSATTLAFKNANEADFLVRNITLTNSGSDIIFESTTNGLDFLTEVSIVHTNDYIISSVPYTSAPNTTPRVQIDKITLSGVKGSADIKVNRLARISDFTTSPSDTAAQFVTNFADGFNTSGDIVLTSSGPDIIFTGKTNGSPFTGNSSIISKSSEGNIEELSYVGEFMDYKGPTAASKLRGYPADEYVRLGVLFFDLKGKPFFVRWLDNISGGGHGDVYIPARDTISGGSNQFLANYDKTTFAEGDEFAQTNSRNAYLVISGLDITPVKDLISGFMIVRAPIVHRNLAYGNLSFISADILTGNIQKDDYYLNPGYFMYSEDADKVPGVYAFISPEDLFDFKGFVISKGDKLKNILYLSPERKAYAQDGGFTGMGKRETQPHGSDGKVFENLYSKFYLPSDDGECPSNGKDEVKHEILYSIKYNVGDGSVGDPSGVPIDPRNVNKLFKDRTRDVDGPGGLNFSSNPGKMNIVVLDIDETGHNVKGDYHLGNGDPRMLICSIYRDNNDPYGGYGDASLANTLYMSTGHYQNINASVLADIAKDGKYIFNNIEIYGGDTFVCLFDHKRNLFNEDDGANQYRVGYSTIFPVESRINITLRQGNHVAKNHSYSPADPFGIRRKVNAMKLEDYNYNDGYSSDNINALYHALPFGFINNSKFEARMRYTQPKVPGEKVDRFRIFPPLNKIDLSINFGIITNIRENYSNLLYWQEDQIGYIPINERQLASNAFGNAIQLGVGGLFERYDEIVTELGNSHQFGLIDSPVGYHWYDAKRRMYLTLYKDMKLSQDSIISGLNTFFDKLPDMIYHSEKDVIDKSMDSLRYDNPGKDFGICGGFDAKNKIVFTTFFQPVDDKIETVGISTLNNKFIGFFDYQSRFYFEMKNGLYSFKKNYAELHRHNTGEFLTLHGEFHEGDIQIVIKDPSNLDKIYDTFDFIGNENFFNKIRYQNSNQDIDEVVDPNSLEEYRYRNKRWYGTVPLIDRARIMDSHMLVTFKVTVPEEVELYQVTFNTRRML